MLIKKLKSTDEIIEFTNIFNAAIGYSNVPWQYHASGKCYALCDNSKMVAGFCLIPGYFNLRSVLQMPEEKQKEFYSNYPKTANNLSDLTGYFINNPNLKQMLLFTLFLVVTCFFHRKKYFIYTYPVSDRALEKYYGTGDPIRIHTGIPIKLPGHAEHMESENIEILTSWGVFKIFFYRTKRILKAKFRKR